MKFICDICGLVKRDAPALEKHFLSRHRNAKKVRYACDYPGCGVTFDKYDSLRYHRSKHPQASASNNDLEQVDDWQDVSDDDADVVGPSQLKSLVGYFLLQMRSDDRLSDKAIVNLAKNLEQLKTDFAGIVKQRIAERLGNAGETNAAALIKSPQFADIFSPTEIFQPFRTVYQQNKFIQEHFKLVEPIEIKVAISKSTIFP
jgi:hypothetical protein